MKGTRIVRNAAALLAGQPITWVLTLVFTVIVPRNVGPAEWGEWTIAVTVGQLALMAFDLGTNTVLLKGISRYPDDSERTLGVAFMLRLVLTPVVVLAMVGFSLLAGYSAHTRLLVSLYALAIAASYATVPVVSALQALEKMHFSAVASVLNGAIVTAGAFVIVKLLGLGVISIAFLALAAQLVSTAVLVFNLRRLIRTRIVLDLDLIGQLVREGLPYWATGGFFMLYAWLDGVMLSVMGATVENGWYGVAMRMVATPGFMLVAVTSAVFPVISRGLATGGDGSANVVGRSFRLLLTLSLPMAAGLMLLSDNLVTLLYGGWFAPAGAALAVLAFTIPPVFVATLVNQCLVAADRQIQWTVVMAGLCVVNLGLNLFTIPYFHAHYQNGALGASIALLVTDVASGAMGLILLPASLRPAVRATLPAILGAALATVVMAAVVWPLRHSFLPIPIVVGGVVFIAAALLFRVFPRDELDMLLSAPAKLARIVRPRRARRALPPPTVLPAHMPSPRAMASQSNATDAEVA
jgi:O-antigen/teichoic acid export membrane protein